MKGITGKTYSRDEILGYILRELATKLEEFYSTQTIK